MANIRKISEKNNVTLLDKLAQLTPISLSDTKQLAQITKDKLFKRAKAKYVTIGITKKLYLLDSPLRNSYKNTFFCSNVLKQSGKTLTSTYCNNRWCIVCNRIRTAKLIAGYQNVLSGIPDKQFLTLTVPNVSADVLEQTMKQMIRNFVLIVKRLRKQKVKVVLLRKLECTYNPIRNDFHPHFHCIVSMQSTAQLLLDEWLKTYKDATRAAQNIREADDASVKELFKYFCKIVTKGKVYETALDVIFQSMYRQRVFQPVGIKKDVPEDIDDLISEIYSDLQQAETFWTWIENDWICVDTGELLTNYKPSETVNKLLVKSNTIVTQS